MKDSQFLQLFIGKEGAQALSKSARAIPSINTVIAPTVLSTWISLVENFDGEVLGKSIKFQKNEDGTYNGSVQFSKGMSIDFTLKDIFYVVSAIAVAHDLTGDIGNIKKTDLTALNKTISALVTHTLNKSQMVGINAGLAAKPLAAMTPTPPSPPSMKPLGAKAQIPGMPKADPSLLASQGVPPNEIHSPSSSTGTSSLGTMKLPSLKLKKSEIVDKCATKHFKEDVLKGCLCIRGLLKTTTVELKEDTYVLVNTNNLGLSDFGFIADALKGF